MNIKNWDHLRVFLAIAQQGSLSSAAATLGQSQPTVTRVLQSLEKECGTALAVRHSRGLTLTSRGLDLLQVAKDVEKAANLAPLSKQQTIQIAAGGWMSRFLASHALFLTPTKTKLVILNSYGFSNLDNAEADIALRNTLPKTGYIRVRKFEPPAYAVYGLASKNFNLGADGRGTNWIEFTSDQADLPSQKWINANAQFRKTILQCNQAINILDAVLSGAGVGILPRFVGDQMQCLKRLTPNLKFNETGLWLLVHQDQRQNAKINHIIAAFQTLLKQNTKILHP